jgi:hypothetical protein
MTWVVATPTRFGDGFGLSDICVTLDDGTEVDCLQKLHPVGRYVAAGFSGDVEIGFAMIDQLRRLCDLKNERLSCDSASIATGWPAAARSVFDGFSADNQDGGSSFGPCRDAIERYARDNSNRMMFVRAESTPGGMGSMLGFSLTDLLIRTEPRWVSSYLHYCCVYRGAIILKTNYHRRKGRWSIADLGAGVAQGAASSAWAHDANSQHVEMPAIATSWRELVELLDSRGATAMHCRS